MKIIMEIEEDNLPSLFGCAKNWVDISGKLWFVAEVYFIEPTEENHVRIGVKLIGITASLIEKGEVPKISINDIFKHSVDFTHED